MRPVPFPFSVSVPQAVLDDLRARLEAARWPETLMVAGGERRERLEAIGGLLARWRESFDWRAWERRLAGVPQVRVEVEGVGLHAVWRRADRPDARALLLVNGWPSSFLEYLPVLDLLAADVDVVVPSRPGYGFSDPALDRPLDDDDAARLFVGLMAALGYERFVAHGDDFGGTIASRIGLRHPEVLDAISVAEWIEAPGGARTGEERAYVAGLARWHEAEYGYGHVAGTRPQTLGLGLDDSPLGLLAWIADKWLSWSDGPMDPDLVLATTTLYWVTQSMTTSMRPYAERPPDPGAGEAVTVPTWVVAEHGDRPAPPRSWLERVYSDLRSYRVRDAGGHFLAAERPGAFVAELRAFLAEA